MSKLRLEVGKSYRNLMGDTVKIVQSLREVVSMRYNYRCNNGRWYKENGAYSVSDKDSLYDLIEEVHPEPKRRKVKWPIRGRVKRKESSEAIYYTPEEVEMIIGNPPYTYPEAEESFGPNPETPELVYTQAEYAAALRLAGIDTNRPELFYKIAALMQETTGNPTMMQVMGVWDDNA